MALHQIKLYSTSGPSFFFTGTLLFLLLLRSPLFTSGHTNRFRGSQGRVPTSWRESYCERFDNLLNSMLSQATPLPLPVKSPSPHPILAKTTDLDGTFPSAFLDKLPPISLTTKLPPISLTTAHCRYQLS